MKRLPHDREQLDVLELFEAVGQRYNLQIEEVSGQQALETFRVETQRQLTPIARHGRRIQTMFGYVAASLGSCSFIKTEECGLIFAEQADLGIPDYRVVTKAGQHLLVEVKNCHKLTGGLSMKASYLEGLRRYADMLSVELRFAIYWSRWKCWTLLSPEDLHCSSSTYVITLPDSIEHNRMATLGDYAIGTTPPLVFRILADASKSRSLMPNGETVFTIEAVQMECDGKLITKKDEQRIAFYLMRYGRWLEETRTIIEDGELHGIEFEFRPLEHASTQRFSVIGFLSGMISRHYDERTTSSGKVNRLAPNVDPEKLGLAIPRDYEGHRLPLWRFTVQPST